MGYLDGNWFICNSSYKEFADTCCLFAYKNASCTFLLYFIPKITLLLSMCFKCFRFKFILLQCCSYSFSSFLVNLWVLKFIVLTDVSMYVT